MIFVKPFFQKFLSVHCKVVQCATHTRPPFYISPRFSASCFCLNRTFRYDTTYSFRPLSDLTLFSFAGGEGVKQRTHARTLYPTGAPHRTGSTSGIQRRSRSQEPQDVGTHPATAGAPQNAAEKAAALHMVSEPHTMPKRLQSHGSDRRKQARNGRR